VTPPIFVRHDGVVWRAWDRWPEGFGNKETEVPYTAATTADACCRAVWDRYGGRTPVMVRLGRGHL